MTLYALLGVPTTASAAELKAAWRALARELHPDRNPDDAAAAEKLAAVNAAYTVLSDPDKRRQYDQYGEDAASAFFDESLVKPAPTATRPQRAKAPPPPRKVEAGADIETELVLTAEEAWRGGIFELVVEPAERCAHCGGTGWRRAGRACSKCEGGVIPGIGPFRLQVPPRVLDGQTLVVAGEGRAGRGKGAQRGDLRVGCRVLPTYERTAEGVFVRVPCPSTVRREGGKVRVPLPSGGAVKMTVPAGTRLGQKLRLRGKGGQGVDLLAVLVEGPTGPVPIQAVKVNLG